MAAWGHSKTALECRAKSKAMRLRYKKIVALNAKSGHNAVTCPFYEELDRILGKSKDIYPEAGVLQSRPRGRRESQTPTPSSEDASLELFSDGSQDNAEPQPSTSSHAGSDVQGTTRPPSPDADDVPIGYGTPETPAGDDREAEEPLENQDRDPEQLPPDVYMADLTASERAAFTKARKKRISALQSVGELLAAQAWEEHREAQREDRRDFQEFLQEMRAARQEDQEARAMMLAAMDRSQNSTNKLTRVVSLLVQAHVVWLTTSQPPNQDLHPEAALGVSYGRSAHGTDSGIQWHMPPSHQRLSPPTQVMLPKHSTHWSHSAGRYPCSPQTPSHRWGRPPQVLKMGPMMSGLWAPPTQPPQSLPIAGYNWATATQAAQPSLARTGPPGTASMATNLGPRGGKNMGLQVISTLQPLLNPGPQDNQSQAGQQGQIVSTPQHTVVTLVPTETGFRGPEPSIGRGRAVRIKKKPKPYSP
ncbi:UNVERIFIED_CONTAM: hypothetical protein K2H54_006229 [Gekko kuhli]